MASAALPHDLTQTLLPNLDRHLGLPLLTFLEERALYPAEQLLRAKIALLRPTRMVTFIRDLEIELDSSKSQDKAFVDDAASKEAQVVKQQQELLSKGEAIMDIVTRPEVVAALKQDKSQNLAYLKDNHNLTTDQLDALYHLGRFQYSIGQYSSASDYLYHFRVLTTDPTLESSAMWGKLVCDILEGSWDAALGELDLLRKHIDTHYPWESRNSVIGLQQRTWFLHWSLFVFFNAPGGRDRLVDAWMHQTAVGEQLRPGALRADQRDAYAYSFLPTLQANAPWLLRYLVAAALLSRKAAFRGSVYIGAAARVSSREHLGAALLTAIRQERYQFRDPIVDFLHSLFSELDFALAAEKLQEARRVLENDFFLSEFADELVDRARVLYSEAYCRVHHRIDIASLSEQLGLPSEEGERWIVNLVRDARLDAKIDFEKNIISMNRPTTSAHQTVIDKTKSILERSTRIAQAMDPTADASSYVRGTRGRGRGSGIGRGGGRAHASGDAPPSAPTVEPVA